MKINECSRAAWRRWAKCRRHHGRGVGRAVAPCGGGCPPLVYLSSCVFACESTRVDTCLNMISPNPVPALCFDSILCLQLKSTCEEITGRARCVLTSRGEPEARNFIRVRPRSESPYLFWPPPADPHSPTAFIGKIGTDDFYRDSEEIGHGGEHAGDVLNRASSENNFIPGPHWFEWDRTLSNHFAG